MEDKKEIFLRNRIKELANKCFYKEIQTNTVFLNLHEQTIFYSMQNELPRVKSILFGGFKQAERKIVCFLPYYEDKADTGIISYIKIEPKNSKFAEQLTHRDFLGAFMNLGLERHTIGDIFIKDNIAYLAVLGSVEEIVFNNLDTIKHTKVKLSKTCIEEIDFLNNGDVTDIFVSSRRLDVVIAAVYSKSRSVVSELFMSYKVFVNGKETTNHSYIIKEDDMISVRGFGRLRFIKEEKLTKKGRLVISVEIF